MFFNPHCKLVKNEVLWNLANWKQAPSPTLSSRLENRGVDSLWDGTSAARSCGDQKGVLRWCKIIRFYKILQTANKTFLPRFSCKELRRPERCFITVFYFLGQHMCSLEEKKNSETPKQLYWSSSTSRCYIPLGNYPLIKYSPDLDRLLPVLHISSPVTKHCEEHCFHRDVFIA